MVKPETTEQAVLMADDDEDIVNLVRFLLARQGYEIHVAADGRQTLEIIEKISPPRLILLDIMLPYMDGFELISHVRKKPGWQDVPIVMLTAKSSERDIVRALDAGANDYMVKPFNPEELLARLRRFMKSPA
jgi:DNA-binding response OmpR family regulator